MAIRRFSHLGLCVADLDRALAFYTKAIGFAEVARLSFSDATTRTLLALPEAELEAVYLRRDGFTLELLHFPSPGTEPQDAPRPMNRTGLTHLSFQVTDLELSLSAVRAAGGRVLDESHIDVNGGAIMVLDPDGTRIELVSGDFDPATWGQGD